MIWMGSDNLEKSELEVTAPNAGKGEFCLCKIGHALRNMIWVPSY